MILIDKLGIQSGKFRLRDVTFEIPSGSYGVLMGKTGSGKTTILEAIAGLRPVTSGRIVLGDVDVTCRKPAERNIGFVPQDAALFSTMSVRDHLAFALVVRRAARADVVATVAQMAELLEIGHLLDRMPERLSGGEKQRVALGRALAFKPATLCLDEPLAALDDDTRAQMMGLLKHVQHETGVTALHITHNRREAAALADVFLELIDGKVRRLDGP
ncbi:MAG: ATP-binding cassette domain-containing protein [Planctomycetota bacterium]